MVPPILKHSKKRSRPNNEDGRRVTFGGDGDNISQHEFERPHNNNGQLKQDQDDDQDLDDDDEEIAVDVSYDEGHALMAKKRRQSHDDDFQFRGNRQQGEEAVDSTYSLLFDKHAGVCPVEAFNLEEERNSGDGYFDGDTFVFRNRKHEQEQPDAWLDALEQDSSQIQHDYVKEGDEDSSQDDIDEQPLTTDNLPAKCELVEQLVEFLATPDETVATAMRRYGRLMNKNSKSTPDSAQASLQKLTSITNKLLLQHNEHDIYQKTRADLISSLHPKTDEQSFSKTYFPIDPATKPTKPNVHWEYIGQVDQQTHGPFTTQQMIQWISAGYFVAESAVKVRPIPAASQAQVDDLIADLQDSDDEEDSSPSSSTQWMNSDQVDFDSYL